MPNTVICHYRVANGNQRKFEELLDSHWPTLHKLGLVTDDPPQRYRGKEQDNDAPIYFEIFTWRDGGVDHAHEHPDVLAVWEPMDALCEQRGTKPNMEFPHVEAMN